MPCRNHYGPIWWKRLDLNQHRKIGLGLSPLQQAAIAERFHISPPPRLSALTLCDGGAFCILFQAHKVPLRYASAPPLIGLSCSFSRMPQSIGLKPSGFHGRELPCIVRRWFPHAAQLRSEEWTSKRPEARLPTLVAPFHPFPHRSYINAQRRGARLRKRQGFPSSASYTTFSVSLSSGAVPAITGGASPGIPSCTAVLRGGPGPHRYPGHNHSWRSPNGARHSIAPPLADAAHFVPQGWRCHFAKVVVRFANHVAATNRTWLRGLWSIHCNILVIRMSRRIHSRYPLTAWPGLRGLRAELTAPACLLRTS